MAGITGLCGVVSQSRSWLESGVAMNDTVEGVRAGTSHEGGGHWLEVEPDSAGMSGCLMSHPAVEQMV